MPALLCPTSEQLSAFQAGKLSLEELDDIASHLETCAHCQTALETGGAIGDTLMHELRQAHESDAYTDESGCHRAIARIEAIANGKSTHTHDETADNVPPSSAPMTLGKYRLLAQIGQGGMGTVYKATHTLLKRTVALKVLPAERMRNPHAVSRFRREIEAAGRLDHPHIVRASDADEADGQHFLVMEWLDGEDLLKLVRRQGPLPVPQACDFIRQAALGLDYAHQHGLVHRDVKPSNLMLATVDGRPVVKVLDLGLALLNDNIAAEAELTSDGQVMGTYDFISPEQAMESHTVDARADMYSLGCAFYFLLAGQVPFQGKSEAKKLLAHQLEKPNPLTHYRTDVPSEVIAVVAKMMSKDPAKRFGSMRELAETLERSSQTQIVAAQAVADTITEDAPPATVLAKRARRRVPVLATLAVALLLLGGGGVWLVPQIIIRITEKDGKVTELKAPEDAKIEIIRPAPPPIPRGDPLSPLALVSKPALIKGVESWTLETRMPRGEIAALAYQPAPGRWLASAGKDGTIRLWDPDNLKLVRALVGHAAAVTALAWSPDGKALASVSEDNTVRIWEMESGKQRFVFWEKDKLRAVAWSVDGKLAAGGITGDVIIWEADSGRHLETVAKGSGTVNALAWSPDGQALAWGGKDKILRLRDMKTGETQTAKDHGATINAVAWAPDGKTLASGDWGKNQSIKIWQAQTGQLIRSLESNQYIRGLAWSPEGKTLTALGQDAGYTQYLEFWDVAAGQKIKAMPARTSGSNWDFLGNGLAWSHDGKFVVSCGGGSNSPPQIHFWDAGSFTLRKTLEGQPRLTIPPAWSPQGETLVAGTNDTVFFWNGKTGMMQKTSSHTGRFEDFAWSPDGKYLAAQSHLTSSVLLLDPRTGQIVRSLKAISTARGLAWSPDSKKLAVGDLEVVRLWEADTGILLKDLKDLKNAQTANVYGLAWSPDGKTLVSGGVEEQTARFWDPDTGLMLRSMQNESGSRGGFRSFVWARDGKTIFSCRYNGKIPVWQAETGKNLQALEGHTAPVGILAGSPDGKLLASGSQDRTIRLWDIASLTHVRTIAGHTGVVSKLSWSADSKYLASAVGYYTYDGTVRLWEAATGRGVGLLLPLMNSQGLALTPEGHYRGTPALDRDLVYVVQTERGQETLTSTEFTQRFGWKNQPDTVRLAGLGDTN